MAIFSPEDNEHFLRDGYVMLRGGFPSEVAVRAREVVRDRLDVSPDEPESWSETMIHIQDIFYEPPFDEIMNDRIRGAADELAGVGRAKLHPFYGWWPVLFPGFEGPGGWHVDGSNFHHRLASKEQALVTLYLFSDIDQGEGGGHRFPAPLPHPRLQRESRIEGSLRVQSAIRTTRGTEPRPERWRLLAGRGSNP